MLVIHRKAEESIVLSFLHIRIQITVLAIEGARVKVGISAPPDVAIVREELLHHSSPEPQGDTLPHPRDRKHERRNP